jgi:2-keto-4-pentenoate hydratase
MRVLTLAALALTAATLRAEASCGTYDFASAYAADFFAARPFADAPRAAELIRTLPDGACHQDQLLKLMEAELGPVVGYKAAATSPGAQQQLGLTAPVLGVLYEEMIRPDGSTVKVSEGARLIFELDLLARVGSAAINDATTRAEALAAIDAFVPFVELGDLMVPKGAAVTGPLVQAMNAGGRLGVAGTPIPSDGLDEDALAAAAGRLTVNGAVVAEAQASALLGHPLDAVLWIVAAAKARGMTLKEGDVLSLGSMGRFQQAAPGAIEATYTGIAAEPATVRLTLE